MQLSMIVHRQTTSAYLESHGKSGVRSREASRRSEVGAGRRWHADVVWWSLDEGGSYGLTLKLP